MGLRKTLNGHIGANEIDQHTSQICGDHCTLKTKTSPARDIECCSLDKAMIVASEIGMAKRVTQCKPIKAAFNAGDVDGDGVMTFDEFEVAVISLLPDVHHAQLIRMFRDALSRSHTGNPNALTPEAFANAILRAQGFAARYR